MIKLKDILNEASKYTVEKRSEGEVISLGNLQIAPIASSVIEHSSKFGRTDTKYSEKTFVIVKYKAWFYIPAVITKVVPAKQVKGYDYMVTNIYGEKYRLTYGSTIYEINDNTYLSAIKGYFKEKNLI